MKPWIELSSNVNCMCQLDQEIQDSGGEKKFSKTEKNLQGYFLKKSLSLKFYTF